MKAQVNRQRSRSTKIDTLFTREESVGTACSELNTPASQEARKKMYEVSYVVEVCMKLLVEKQAGVKLTQRQVRETLSRLQQGLQGVRALVVMHGLGEVPVPDPSEDLMAAIDKLVPSLRAMGKRGEWLAEGLELGVHQHFEAIDASKKAVPEVERAQASLDGAIYKLESAVGAAASVVAESVPPGHKVLRHLKHKRSKPADSTRPSTGAVSKAPNASPQQAPPSPQQAPSPTQQASPQQAPTPPTPPSSAANGIQGAHAPTAQA